MLLNNDNADAGALNDNITSKLILHSKNSYQNNSFLCSIIFDVPFLKKEGFN
jgi:hypothetical protein